jgi:hypothetical protein
MNPHRVADLCADDRSWQLTVERPHLLHEPGGDRHLPLFDDELDLDQVPATRRTAGHERDSLTLASGGRVRVAQLVWRRVGVSFDSGRRRTAVAAGSGVGLGCR